MADHLDVIALDGPAGSGKSTVARRVAAATGLDYLDTGAMYRSVTYATLRRQIDPDDADAVATVARTVDIRFGDDGDVSVDGADATIEIRGPQVTAAVSAVAANPDVRTEMVSRQRQWARRRGGGVLEGRDIGTVVFPNATLKVYLTADERTRAARRAADQAEPDTGSPDVDAVAADLARRDALDSNRSVDPLRRADGAVEIDTSGLSIDDVVTAVLELFEAAKADR